MNYSKTDIDNALNDGIIYILDKDTIKDFLNQSQINITIPTEILLSDYIEIYMIKDAIIVSNKNIHLTFDIKTESKAKTLATEQLNDVTTNKNKLIQI